MDAAYAVWTSALWYAFALAFTLVAVFVTGVFYGCWMTHRALWLARTSLQDLAGPSVNIEIEDDDDGE